MQLRQLDRSGRDTWNEFVASVAVADVLQSYEWGELKGSFGWTPHRLLLERDGAPVAAAQLLERSFRGLGKSLFYCPRGPVLDYGDRALLGEVIEQLRNYCHKRRGFLLKIDPAVEVAAQGDLAQALTGAGFRQLADEGGFGGTQPRCVMKLDLSPGLDELLAACKSKTRYNIRLASRKGVEIRDDCGAADLASFYELLRVTATRDGFSIRPLAYFQRMMELLSPAGFARLFMAFFEDQPIAGAVVTRFGATCCYLYGASSNEHRNRMPNHLMQWRMIEWAHSQGCAVYDFRGVSPDPAADGPLGGLNRFKAGFSPEFVEYFGEFDLPLSRPHYFLWTVGRPAATRILKRIRRSVTPEKGS